MTVCNDVCTCNVCTCKDVYTCNVCTCCVYIQCVYLLRCVYMYVLALSIIPESVIFISYVSLLRPFIGLGLKSLYPASLTVGMQSLIGQYKLCI